MVSLDFHMFAMGRANQLFYGGEEAGGGGFKQKKNKIMQPQEKKEENWYTRKHGKTFMQVSPILGICITGMLERKFSYF